MKRKRKKRSLFKPHLMLQFMPGFIANLNTRDVWTVLAQNWTFFYWLTGETPQSLAMLVRSLQNNFHHFNRLGRNSALDFRNQVYQH